MKSNNDFISVFLNDLLSWQKDAEYIRVLFSGIFIEEAAEM